jgi:hypothetical protein
MSILLQIWAQEPREKINHKLQPYIIRGKKNTGPSSDAM